MSDTQPTTFRELARRATRLHIAGENVDPKEVAVKSTVSSTSGVSFTMEISCVALLHELREAGLSLDHNDLERSVREDLREHPQEALTAYLRIVQGIFSDEKPSRFSRFFRKLKPPITPKWSITQVQEVSADCDRITLFGSAIRH